MILILFNAFRAHHTINACGAYRIPAVLALSLNILLFQSVWAAFGNDPGERQGMVGKSKPGWFWNQPVDCGMTAIGITRQSTVYPENAKKLAHEKSIHAYLRQIESHHSGGQAFSITERGAVWLGGDQAEAYDTSRFDHLMEDLPVLDYQVSGNMALVLVGPEACQEEVAKRSRSYTQRHRPAWVDETPSSHGFLYAVGVSEGYYYSENSWEAAESTARRNLSAHIQSRVHGLHDQQSGISHEILYADLQVTLKNATVMSRYYEPDSNLHYVLMRMPVRQP
ncbi:MAG: hypothetical protein ACQETM_04940 [Bacteroidota bacterium]